MGLFGFMGGKKKQQQEEEEEQQAKVEQKMENVAEKYVDKQVMVEETKGSSSSKEVVRLPELPSGPTATDVSVFEFGAALENDDKVTLAGYCPVSDEMEPCRWEILPQSNNEAPGFRIVF